MTKEITKAFILQQIRDKFGLRDLEPERFVFSETVQPIYNVEEHLKETIIKTYTQSITGTGGYIFLTPPPDQRWFLDGYTVVFLAAGAYTVAGVYLTRLASGISDFVYLDLTAAQTVSYTVNLPKTVIVNPGDALYINVDGYTSTANLQLLVNLTRETIR